MEKRPINSRFLEFIELPPGLNSTDAAENPATEEAAMAETARFPVLPALLTQSLSNSSASSPLRPGSNARPLLEKICHADPPPIRRSGYGRAHSLIHRLQRF